MKIQQFKKPEEVKTVLFATYQKQIINYLGDEKKALRFLTSAMSVVQQNSELLACTPVSLINSIMMSAEFGLMPSSISGESYILPYKNKKKVPGTDDYIIVTEAQFQLGYQGIVTLLYRAGAKEVIAELVRKNDVFRLVNGKIQHEVDPFKTTKERGEIIGAYVIIVLNTGGTVDKFMRIEDIYAHGKKFSKSYNSNYSPWKQENDPEGWMIRKTVLRQAAKLAPKNRELIKAIAEDDKDSVIQDRINEVKDDTEALTMGALLIAPELPNGEKKQNNKTEDVGGPEEDPEDTSGYQEPIIM